MATLIEFSPLDTSVNRLILIGSTGSSYRVQLQLVRRSRLRQTVHYGPSTFVLPSFTEFPRRPRLGSRSRPGFARPQPEGWRLEAES